jgi:hypothetical protein
VYLTTEDEFSCDFLLKHGALPTAVLPDSGYSPLHLLADWKSDTVADVSSLLLKQGCSPNAVAEDGRYITAQPLNVTINLAHVTTTVCQFPSLIVFVMLLPARLYTWRSVPTTWR